MSPHDAPHANANAVISCGMMNGAGLGGGLGLGGGPVLTMVAHDSISFLRLVSLIVPTITIIHFNFLQIR